MIKLVEIRVNITQLFLVDTIPYYLSLTTKSCTLARIGYYSLFKIAITTPLKKMSYALVTHLNEQFWILLLHFIFGFPRCLFRLMVRPKYVHDMDILIASTMHLFVKNLHKSFLICEATINIDPPRLLNMMVIRDITLELGNVKHIMHLLKLHWQPNL